VLAAGDPDHEYRFFSEAGTYGDWTMGANTCGFFYCSGPWGACGAQALAPYIVGAAEFVRRLPDGVRSQVEERGGTFSQGERQLLAFARALVVEPDLLVLDEATASIDSESEARLQRALRIALDGRTALVVAHRLSTVRHADRILVVERGVIVEAGRHDELLARRGAYARMLAQVEAPA